MANYIFPEDGIRIVTQKELKKPEAPTRYTHVYGSSTLTLHIAYDPTAFYDAITALGDANNWHGGSNLEVLEPYGLSAIEKVK